MVVLLQLMARRLETAGLMTLPDHYHNAVIYSRMMLCLDPDRQGYLEALRRDLAHLSPPDAAEAVDGRQVRDAETGRPRAAPPGRRSGGGPCPTTPGPGGRPEARPAAPDGVAPSP